jgi:hypothetical protein
MGVFTIRKQNKSKRNKTFKSQKKNSRKTISTSKKGGNRWFKYSKKKEEKGKDKKVEEGSDDICPICRQKLDVKETNPLLSVYTTNCNHTFHMGCLHDSCKTNQTCPLCRRNIHSDCDKIKPNFELKKIGESRLNESELYEVLDESGFMELEDYGDDKDTIRDWKANLRKLKYDENWKNCFTGKVDENIKEQAIAKIKCWIKTMVWE